VRPRDWDRPATTVPRSVLMKAERLAAVDGIHARVAAALSR
jgi:hypothetical protein